MSSVLDRPGLEKSPLADLHLLAGELGVENFRRLRKADLIDAILARQSGEETGSDDPRTRPATTPRRVAGARAAAAAADARARRSRDDDGRRRRGRRRRRRRRRRRSRPTRSRAGARAAAAAATATAAATGRDDGRDRDGDRDRDDESGEDKVAEGVVELLANGSGFVRLAPPEPTDDDVYVSAAQVKRCELVSGDRVSGPVRAPRRSERFPSLVRVDTINGRPADEVAEGTRFEDLPAAFPAERFELGSEDPTVKAIEWLTPFGKGSRVVIAGPARAGKSEALRRIAAALAGREGLEVSVVLAGVRPEEIAEWSDGPVAPVASLSFAASPDAQAQAIEQAIEQGRRVAARGGDAVVLADTLEYLSAGAARRALAAARNIAGGGSLTVIATAASAARRRDDRRRARRGHDRPRPLPGARPHPLGHAAPGAAGRRRGRRGDRQGARRGRLGLAGRDAPGGVAGALTPRSGRAQCGAVRARSPAIATRRHRRAERARDATGRPPPPYPAPFNVPRRATTTQHARRPDRGQRQRRRERRPARPSAPPARRPRRARRARREPGQRLGAPARGRDHVEQRVDRPR